MVLVWVGWGMRTGQSAHMHMRWGSYASTVVCKVGCVHFYVRTKLGRAGGSAVNEAHDVSQNTTPHQLIDHKCTDHKCGV
jgi:hypothetical protein